MSPTFFYQMMSSSCYERWTKGHELPDSSVDGQAEFTWVAAGTGTNLRNSFPPVTDSDCVFYAKLFCAWLFVFFCHGSSSKLSWLLASVLVFVQYHIILYRRPIDGLVRCFVSVCVCLKAQLLVFLFSTCHR